MLEKNPILKQRYRTALGITADILQAMMDSGTKGIFITTISRNVNLSHYAVVENCQKLISAGLVKSSRTARNNIFIITKKGIDFFREFQKFQDFSKQMNLGQ